MPEPRDQFLPIVLLTVLYDYLVKTIQVMYAHQHTIPSGAANVDHRDTVLFQFNTCFHARHGDAKKDNIAPPFRELTG